MRFSAYLRQPAEVSEEEKNRYVEEIIELLELQDLSEALVFSLNVEARKRLTIGVELASKPELLLFLDEPTSGMSMILREETLFLLAGYRPGRSECLEFGTILAQTR